MADAHLIERWEIAHAALMSMFLVVSTLTRASLPLVLASVCSFAVLGLQMQGRFTPSGTFGWANWITGGRLALTVLLLLFTEDMPPLAVATAALLVLGLDAVDGYVARRSAQSSPFGAAFDVEVDALYTATLALLLYSVHGVGAWVVLIGALRYASVLSPLLWPPKRAAPARTVFGRACYVVMIVSLTAACVVAPPWRTALALLATVTVSASFGVSFWQSYRPHSMAPQSA